MQKYLFFVVGILFLASSLSPEEENAMCALAKSTYNIYNNNQTGFDNSWDCSDVKNACNWTNVYCSNSHVVSIVTKVKFHVEGTLPSEIGQLTYLSNLVITYTSLSGTIPSSIGNCPLLYLNLRYNKFTGDLLFLDDLELLYDADLSSNQFNNLPTLPNYYVNLVSLQLLNNNFTEFPTNFLSGKFNNILSLDLSHNYLRGSVPTQFYYVNFNLLSLCFNNLSGILPPMSVSILLLLGNNFNGCFPTIVGNTYCDVSGSKFLCSCTPSPSYCHIDDDCVGGEPVSPEESEESEVSSDVVIGLAVGLAVAGVLLIGVTIALIVVCTTTKSDQSVYQSNL